MLVHKNFLTWFLTALLSANQMPGLKIFVINMDLNMEIS